MALKLAHYTWHRKWTYLPVRLSSGKLVWWDHVERRRLPNGTWEYRMPKPEWDENETDWGANF